MITDEFLSKIAEALQKNNVTLSTLIGDEDEQELVRLARVGLWAKQNCIVSDMRKVAQLGGYFDEALNQLVENDPGRTVDIK